jgi:hypothetical protein
MRRLTLCLLFALAFFASSQLIADDLAPLDNNTVVQLVKWKVTETEIIGAIGRNPTNFQLTPDTIKFLKANGVSDAMLDAMFAATRKAAASGGSPQTPEVKAKPSPPQPQAAGTPGSQPAATPPLLQTHTPQRLAAARGVSATPLPVPNFNTGCPVDNKGKVPSRSISLYFLSGTSDPNTISDSGPVCFQVHDFNDILYTPSFTLTETAPTGSAFDDLQAAIQKVTGLTVGAPSKTAAAAEGEPRNCPKALSDAVTAAQGAAARFSTALAGIDPGKDSSGNVNLVDWHITRSNVQPVPGAYNDLEAAVSQVIAALRLDTVNACSDNPTENAKQALEAAEAIVVDVYLPARTTFSDLQGHVNSNHIVPFTSQVHATSSYTVAVTANSPRGKVAGGTVTFSLAAGRKVLSTSGGFLVTEVPTPSYSSVTAPTGGTPATQNVLAVNNPSGASVGLTALVDVYLPNIHKLRLNGSSWGLALSAGPTYNLANGKADSTKFGLFAGPSLHIRNQFFLTPGFNLAQYSTLPLGFTKAGQVIPPNTGTPTGILHWTTRFAFALTYKIKDFGQSSTPNQAAPANQPPAGTPSTPDSSKPAPKKGNGG